MWCLHFPLISRLNCLKHVAPWCFLHAEKSRAIFSGNKTYQHMIDLISIVTHYVQECVVTEVVLNCISLMTNDAEYLLLCLLPICISYFRNDLFEFPPHILKGLSVFLLGFWSVCLLALINSGCKSFVRIFSPRCGLPFHFLDSVKEQKALILIKSSLSVFLFYDWCFWHPK